MEHTQLEETRTLPPIRALPPLLVNQIAAGEVVDRPASVVKELIDNALDAGATRIAVETEQGGVELVRVSDNGVGIPAEQIPLAVAPHATSKITEASDLERIGTMGFRGEALASIASVSRLSIRSRPEEQEEAALIEASGETISAVRPEAGPCGTVVAIRNLFFNTPARRRFLRAASTEQGHVNDVVRALAMAHPHVAFESRSDGRVTLELPAGQSQRERAVAILGREFETSLLEVHADEYDGARGLTLWGLIGLPEIARATTKGQRFFVNGRPIRDPRVQHALQEAYRGLIEPGRRPMAVLMLEMDPKAVDVNVHPAKAEVRFRDGGLVHAVVHRAVRDALRQADLTPRWTRPAAQSGAPYGDGFAEHLQSPEPAAPGAPLLDPWPGAGPIPKEISGERIPPPPTGAPRAPESGTSYPQEWSAPSAPAFPTTRPVERVLQVHNAYLVTQDDKGMLIVDQHALHERVMFEKIMARLAAGPLESQRLLAPLLLDASDARLAAIDRLGALFERLGVEAGQVSPQSIGVHAFPSFLLERGVEPTEFLADLLDKTADGDLPAQEEAAIHEVVDMMACKAAVKAGDRLSDQELEELLAMRERVERSSNCPHGRPTSIRLTLADLEKQFERR